MKQIKLGKTDLAASEIALGCMRMCDLSTADAGTVIQKSREVGINLFDHADIYGGGLSEEIFSKAVKEQGIARDKMLLQTKCGIEIKDGTVVFNFSKDYIISCVEGSLKRLQTDYVDLLALHRPDTLMQPEEIAEAFDVLHKAGKVRYFGVSNQLPGQMELIQRATPHKLTVNQLQFGLVHTGMIDAGLNANMKNAQSLDHDGGLLEYCRLNDVTIQAWSPFRPEISGSVFLDNPAYPELNAQLQRLADKYNVSKDAIATAWILRHPAQMQVIIGSMNPARIDKIAKATGFTLDRDEWYALYKSAGNDLP